MKPYFLQPGDNSSAINKLIELFESEMPLYVAVAYFNSEIFSDLIINRRDKCLKTYLLLNTSDVLRPQGQLDTDIAISGALMKVLKAGYKNDYIETKSLGIKRMGKYQNMHHKFYVNDFTVLFGSVNLTNAALHNNYESLFETTNQEIIQNFKDEFDKLWKLAPEIYYGKEGLRTLICPNCERNEGIDFESYGPYCTYCGHRFKVV